MESDPLKNQNHSAFKLYYHIIFTVKYRKKCITAPMLTRRSGYHFGCPPKMARKRLVEFNGEEDHVHLLIEAHPALDLSRLIGNLKTVSARRFGREYAEHLKQFFWKPYFWNKAYAVITVGGRANLETLLKYIQDQDAPQA